jgi:hypothetical protein
VALAVVLAALAACSSHPSLAHQYLRVAGAGNRSLDHSFDALDGRDRDDLAKARVDLRAIASTEHHFDRQLLLLALPPAMAKTAATLVRVNETRAALTLQAAASTSLAQLRTQLPQLAAANGPVEDQVRSLRRQLGLPPPSTS